MSHRLTPPPDTEERPINTPTYLIPLSKSALSSSQLQTNQKRLAPTAELKSLRSGWRAAISTAFRLAPTLKTSHYTLGTGNNNDIVIHTGEDECWVNFQHCQLIPDPDRATITVSNKSRTTFTVQNINKRDAEVEILPSRPISISEGKWYLTLGQGLQFLVIVPPRNPDIHRGLLIHSGPSQNLAKTRFSDKTAPPSAPGQKHETVKKGGRKARRTNHRRRKTREFAPATHRVNKLTHTRGNCYRGLADGGTYAPGTDRTLQKPVATGPVHKAPSITFSAAQSAEKITPKSNPMSPTSNGSSRRKDVISSTDRTRVLKDEHHGVVIAAKIFRNASLDAASWENEKRILAFLKSFQNVSFLPITILSYP